MTMRLAIFSDIHGNSIALDAVLSDIEAQGGVDGYWVLGDFAALGHDPVGSIERVNRLPNLRCVRGNTDRYLNEGGPKPPPEELQDPQTFPLILEVGRSFAWTQGAVATLGREWLEQLPLEQRMTLPDGTRLLGVHAAPGTDDGEGLNPGQTDDELRDLLRGCDADLVCVGHTHWAMDRSVDGIRVINLGSVSNPMPPDLRASYIILTASAEGYEIESRRVDYDRDAVITALDRLHHPGAPYIKRFMFGQAVPQWKKKAGLT